MNIMKNISIKKLNTFGIDVKSKLFCKIESENDITSLIISDEFIKMKECSYTTVLLCF